MHAFKRTWFTATHQRQLGCRPLLLEQPSFLSIFWQGLVQRLIELRGPVPRRSCGWVLAG